MEQRSGAGWAGGRVAVGCVVPAGGAMEIQWRLRRGGLEGGAGDTYLAQNYHILRRRIKLHRGI
ncbi:hypothetical protein ACRE_057480 [Hapsidospora chrysogenum ATCC 11550]|uniref:Uncharacterized protein n=1 Tax=Hapsidospora chrysogenum (strain ATCC 11550 / CBS 779.69 / DSM 880 / IAM 14645 / JCM 23072 / IMI 49137) TaxID=857340 RepID=A0A086T2A5_HAPC1|nr:hypothetical protein ACRE_057480 [Hapsidospora chrysogenum ATCC 11550]